MSGSNKIRIFRTPFMNDNKLFRQSFLITLGFVGVLWAIKSWERAAAADLSFLGIYPRTLKGSIGILTSPFIHGDVHHLISNTFPLVILGTGLFFFYRAIALEVFWVVYFSTGLWVWAVARPAFHIGASGLVYGIAAFLFFIGLLRKDARSLAVSMVVVFLYHGLFAGMFSLSPAVSWESHLLGGCSGIMCALYYRNKIKAEEPESTAEQTPENSEQAWQPTEKNEGMLPPVSVPENFFVRFSNSSRKVAPEKTAEENEEDGKDLISLN